MSILGSDMVSGAYQLLGRPSQLDLNYNDVLLNAARVVRGLILDLKLSVRNHKTAVSDWITTSTREMSTSDFFHSADVLVSKVEWRYLAAASQDPIPFKAEVVAYEQINEVAKTSQSNQETYVAFYNDNGTMAFSEIATVLALRQYRVMYETLSNEALATLAATAGLPAIFTTYGEALTAKMSLDQVENLTEAWIESRERRRPMINALCVEWKPRFEKYTHTYFGNLKVKKLGFRPRIRYER